MIISYSNNEKKIEFSENTFAVDRKKASPNRRSGDAILPDHFRFPDDHDPDKPEFTVLFPSTSNLLFFLHAAHVQEETL